MPLHCCQLYYCNEDRLKTLFTFYLRYYFCHVILCYYMLIYVGRSSNNCTGVGTGGERLQGCQPPPPKKSSQLFFKLLKMGVALLHMCDCYYVNEHKNFLQSEYCHRHCLFGRRHRDW